MTEKLKKIALYRSWICYLELGLLGEHLFRGLWQLVLGHRYQPVWARVVLVTAVGGRLWDMVLESLPSH